MLVGRNHDQKGNGMAIAEKDLEVSERHLVQVARGNPTLNDLLQHYEKFGGDIQDTLEAALHLSDDDFDILEAALKRREAAAKKARYK